MECKIIIKRNAPNFTLRTVTKQIRIVSQGKRGLQGEPGADGAQGAGVPLGGSTGQILVKLSNADNDTAWQNNVTGAVWGAITGDIADQADLQAILATFLTDLSGQDTDDLSEGSSNLYYTQARFNTAFGAKSTTDLAEGTNLYYTNVRADARITAQKGVANGLATLGSDGLIPTSQLPALAITDTFVVASQVAMLALTAETGDVAVRTDQNKSYILAGTDPTVLGDWQELLTPTDTVLSVNGQTGAVVLTTTNITEGTNEYYTAAKVQTVGDARYLRISNNLSDLNNVVTARSNLGLAAGGAGDIWVEKAGDTMTGRLDLVTGTTTLGPLKFTAGTNLTTPVTGVIEFDGLLMSYTDTGPTRRVFVNTSSTQTLAAKTLNSPVIGSFITTASANNLVLLPNSTGYTVIGDAAATSHTFNTNDDLFVTGRLEVDGTTFLDETLRITKNGDSFIACNVSGGGFVAGFNTNTTLNQMVLFLDTDMGRQLILGNLNYRLNDFDHANQSNPTLFIHSLTDPDVSNNQWGSIAHDQVGLVINTGANIGAGTGATTIDNYISLSTRGTEAMRITGSGDIGINQASPASRLHVAKANGAGDVGIGIQNNATTANESVSVGFITSTSPTAIGSVIRVFRTDANNQTMQIQTLIANSVVERLSFQLTSAVFNEQGADYDFRVEGDTDPNLIFGDSSTDRLGIGTATPNTKLEVAGVLSVKQGTSSSLAKVGGAIFDHFTDTSVGGAEADIYSSTLPANAFGTNGDKVKAYYGGNFVTVGTELAQLKVVLAGTTIWDSTGVAPTTGTTSWRVVVELIRVSATVVRYTVSLNTTGASGFVYCTSGELTGLTLSGTNILKLTGTSSGVGSGAGDIVGKMGWVEWLSAA